MKNAPRFHILRWLLVAIIPLLIVLPACSSGTPSTSPASDRLPAVKLVFTAQPPGGDAGVYFPAPVVVKAVDVNGNVVSGRRLVTLSVTDVQGSSPVTLFGGTTVTSADGVFSFMELSIDRAGTYTLTAKSEGLPPAVSDPVNIVSIGGARLVFSVKVVGGTAGTPLSVQPVVTVHDMYGNVSADAAVDVIISMAVITKESYDAVLSGVQKSRSVNGVARFTDLSIQRAGTYMLAAMSGSLGMAYSNAFDIVPGTPVKLFFNTQPVTVPVGTPLTVMPPAIAVIVQDTYGNTTHDSSTVVTMTITPGTGVSGAVLSGPTVVKAENGVASFEGLTIDKVGTGYTLTATGGSLAPGVSDVFDIIPPGESTTTE